MPRPPARRPAAPNQPPPAPGPAAQQGLTPDEFAALMAPLGPHAPGRRVAVAVSGGADSTALALLAHGWGDSLALIVDHGLRVESAAEAQAVAQRLHGIGITAQILTLRDLPAGPGIAARARAARYAALEAACLQAGRYDLLLGHHAQDQAETFAIRLRARSGQAGLACMPLLRESASLRLLRPLLGVPPARLRATLIAAGLDWVEDPSNRDPRQERARVRAVMTEAQAGLWAAEAIAHGAARADEDQASAAELAACCTLFPQGFVHIAAPQLSAASLRALLRMVGGAAFAPAPAAAARLAARLRPATLGGCRLMLAGRFGMGFLLLREAAAIAPSCPAGPGMLWDGRWRLEAPEELPEAAEIRPGGGPAGLPAAVRAGMPRLMLGDQRLAARFVFRPANPASQMPLWQVAAT